MYKVSPSSSLLSPKFWENHINKYGNWLTERRNRKKWPKQKKNSIDHKNVIISAAMLSMSYPVLQESPKIKTNFLPAPKFDWISLSGFVAQLPQLPLRLAFSRSKPSLFSAPVLFLSTKIFSFSLVTARFSWSALNAIPSRIVTKFCYQFLCFLFSSLSVLSTSRWLLLI